MTAAEKLGKVTVFMLGVTVACIYAGVALEAAGVMPAEPFISAGAIAVAAAAVAGVWALGAFLMEV